MYGIFMECFVALKLYGGNGALLLLLLLSSIFLVVTEKDLKKRILLGILPLLIIAGFLLPITKIVYVAAFDDGSDTYYRLLWLIPTYMVIAYAFCKVLSRIEKSVAKKAVLVAGLIVIAISGSFVYTSQYMSKAENLYHIPQSVIDIVDVIAPSEDEPRVRAAFPSELVHFVRQYNTDILMPYGREMVVTQWDYYNAVYEAMEKPEVIDADELIEATRQTKCRYIILSEDRAIDGDLTELGLTLVDTVDGYYIYEDPEVV